LDKRLRQAAKMEAVGKLAAGVAHDFNNLLTIINGYSELVLDLLNPTGPVRGYIEEIVKAGERATSLGFHSCDPGPQGTRSAGCGLRAEVMSMRTKLRFGRVIERPYSSFAVGPP
jgi:hypothetical protein